jgi:nucleoside transporter
MSSWADWRVRGKKQLQFSHGRRTFPCIKSRVGGDESQALFSQESSVHQFMLFAQEGTSLDLGLRIPLSLMMFLEFAIWGAWFVVLGNYLNSLNFSRKQIARVYATMPIGAIISPMFIGTIADQYFASQHVMAISHIVGGCLLIWLAQIRTPKAFFWVALAYALVYSPTLSLVNTVVFKNVPDTTQFPELRVLGTIGWIVAGMSLKLFIRPGEPVNNRPILLAAALSLLLGACSFALPDTPPSAAGGEIPFIKAVEMFKDPQAAIFFVGALIIAMAMAIYFAFAALFLEQGAGVKPENIGPVMTIGQWVEIFFLFTLSWFIREWGMKWVLVIGMAAWATRFAIFAARPAFPLIAVAVGLHGICFDFFFAAGMIHTQNIAPKDITASAQSLYGVLVYGLGMWLGSEGAGWLNHTFTRETVDPATGAATRVTDWGKFWLVSCIGVVIPLIVFLVFWQPTPIEP